jgi:hypothetical protein
MSTNLTAGVILVFVLLFQEDVVLGQQRAATVKDDMPLCTQPLQERYRQRPTKTEEFTLGESGQLTSGGRWYVTALIRHDKAAPYYGAEAYGGSFPSPANGIISLAAVAIDTETKSVTALFPTHADDTHTGPGLACIGPIIDHESCYVWFQKAHQQAPHDFSSWGLDTPVFEWNLRTNQLVLKGYNWIVAEFAAAAGPRLRQRVVWPKEYDPNWDGTVTIRATEAPHNELRVLLLDTQMARSQSGASDSWWRRPRFLPGAQDNEVVYFYLYGHGPGGAWLSTMCFDVQNKIRWNVSKEQINLGSDFDLSASYVAAGIAHNHQFIPLVVKGCHPDGKCDYLYVIRSQDGSVVLRKSLTPRSATTTAVSSNDGRLIAWTWRVEEQANESLEDQNKSVAVLDVERDVVLAQRLFTKDTAHVSGARLPYALDPVGFDAGKRLIMAAAENVFSLASPYQGPFELQFQLTRAPD